MLSRENAVLAASTTVTMAALVALAGLDYGEYAALAFALFAGAGVVAPQLYLARTDDGVSALSRVRAAAVVTLLLSLGFPAPPGQRLPILVVGLAPLGPLLGYEVLAGYRESRPDAGVE